MSCKIALLDIRAAYDEDAWLWARRQAKDSLQLDLDEITIDQAADCVSRYCEQQQKFLRLVLLDAEREYDEASRIGFGLDGDAQSADAGFHRRARPVAGKQLRETDRRRDRVAAEPLRRDPPAAGGDPIASSTRS